MKYLKKDFSYSNIPLVKLFRRIKTLCAQAQVKWIEYQNPHFKKQINDLIVFRETHTKKMFDLFDEFVNRTKNLDSKQASIILKIYDEKWRHHASRANTLNKVHKLDQNAFLQLVLEKIDIKKLEQHLTV